MSTTTRIGRMTVVLVALGLLVGVASDAMAQCGSRPYYYDPDVVYARPVYSTPVMGYAYPVSYGYGPTAYYPTSYYRGGYYDPDDYYYRRHHHHRAVRNAVIGLTAGYLLSRALR